MKRVREQKQQPRTQKKPLSVTEFLAMKRKKTA